MKLKSLTLLIFISLMLSMFSWADELDTRLIRLQFQDESLLQQFNSRVRLGLSNSLGRVSNQVAFKDEVSNKVDLIYGRVQEILDMHLGRTDLTLVLLSSAADVQTVYQQQYARHASYIAYYSPETNTIYLAADEVNIRVLAHELAHVVIHHYFHKRPPERVHEVLAQHVERQFKISAPKTLK